MCLLSKAYWSIRHWSTSKAWRNDGTNNIENIIVWVDYNDNVRCNLINADDSSINLGIRKKNEQTWWILAFSSNATV